MTSLLNALLLCKREFGVFKNSHTFNKSCSVKNICFFCLFVKVSNFWMKIVSK